MMPEHQNWRATINSFVRIAHIFVLGIWCTMVITGIIQKETAKLKFLKSKCTVCAFLATVQQQVPQYSGVRRHF